MLIILVMCVANIMYVLNKEDNDLGTIEHSFYSVHFENFDFGNAVVFAYTLAMGEYDIDSFQGDNQEFLWMIFFVFTFLLQITFLNMLIAIMS